MRVKNVLGVSLFLYLSVSLWANESVDPEKKFNSDCTTRTAEVQASYVKSYTSGLQESGQDSPLMIELVQNIFHGDVTAIGNKLKSGLNPNTRIGQGKYGGEISALALAVIACQPATAKKLIDAGANVNEGGNTVPLQTAAAYGMNETVEYLLSHGADPELESAIGNTALGEAISNDRYSTVKILLEHGADPNHKLRQVGSPLRSTRTDEGGKRIADLLRHFGAVLDSDKKDANLK